MDKICIFIYKYIYILYSQFLFTNNAKKFNKIFIYYIDYLLLLYIYYIDVDCFISFIYINRKYNIMFL